VPSKSQDQKASPPEGFALADHPRLFLLEHDLCAWGIDLSSKAIDLTIISPQGRIDFHRRLLSGRHSNPGQRYANAHALAFSLGAQLSFKYTPGVVGVEEPFGTGHSKLLPFYGAISAGITGGIMQSCGHPPPVYGVGPSQWKKHLGLKGNCDKIQVAGAYDQWVLDTNQPLPLSQAATIPQDAIDALGVAIFVGCAPPE
jgi:hypothetical protein